MNTTKNPIMKNLPIGISTLAEIRDKDYAFIDKTQHLARLFSAGKYYFLSRPRRFGKSLFIDTLKQAFSGRKDLFHGLYLEHNWDWDKTYPVLHFDFGASSAINSQAVLLDIIWSTMREFAKQYQVSLEEDLSYGIAFQQLIRAIHEKHQQQVVILIDEYDKPILDNITDEPAAVAMREGLKSLYSVIKTNDAHLKFVLLTGVSKFSKVSLFSGLNNLHDISLTSHYADICGYTQSELELEFADYLEVGKVDKVLLKKWYNGYNFAGSEEQKVYNPFDALLFFSNNYEYRSYWFETATPSFLVKLILAKAYYFPNLTDIVVSADLLSNFDVDNIPISTLLFQTGYLTIQEVIHDIDGVYYRLGYPNFEVRTSLNRTLSQIGASVEDYSNNRQFLARALRNNELELVGQSLASHFASIPHDWYRNNNIANYEGFYASVVYSYLAALGYDLIAEDVTNHGKIDLTLKMPDKIIIIEFKLAKYGSAADAIAQIKTRNYAAKYLSESKPIYLLGISFDEHIRNVAEVVSEKLQS